MKVWISSRLFVDPSPLKFGSKNRYQSPETIPRFYFDTSKMKTKKVWIWGFTPPPPFEQNPYFHFHFFWWAPLLSKHSLDWVICKLCGKVSMGLIFTLGTGIFNTFMFRLFVSLKKSLCSCLIFTLVTWTFNTFMFRLLVSLKLVLSCCLIFTLVTWIFNTFMFGLLVSFNIAL